MRRLFLASQSLLSLPDFLAEEERGTVAFVPTAADRLDDTEFVDQFRERLRGTGLEVVDLDLDALHGDELTERLRSADIVAVGGGDPFHLLERARSSGFAELVVDAVDGGTPYVGISAGAMLAGPTLEPALLTSPFEAPDGLDLTALGLVDALVLPHDDLPGRTEKHTEAVVEFTGRVRLVPLRDDQAVVVRGEEIRLVPS